MPVVYAQRGQFCLATTLSQQATAVDTPLAAVSPDQNQNCNIFFFSAISDLNVKLHAAPLPRLRLRFLFLGDTVIRTACLCTQVGAQ